MRLDVPRHRVDVATDGAATVDVSRHRVDVATDGAANFHIATLGNDTASISGDGNLLTSVSLDTLDVASDEDVDLLRIRRNILTIDDHLAIANGDVLATTTDGDAVDNDRVGHVALLRLRGWPKGQTKNVNSITIIHLYYNLVKKLIGNLTMNFKEH